MYNFICKECKKEFTSSKKNRKYCSNECYIKSRNRNSDEKIVGRKFGRLLAVSYEETNKANNQRYYKCLCECGNTLNVSGYSLLKGLSKSCGCSRKESCLKNIKIQNNKFKEKNLVEGTSLSQINASFKNNTSGIKGVLYDKANKSWVAVLTFRGKVYKKRFKGDKEDENVKEKAVQCRKELEELYHKPILEKYKKD